MLFFEAFLLCACRVEFIQSNPLSQNSLLRTPEPEPIGTTTVPLPHITISCSTSLIQFLLGSYYASLQSPKARLLVVYLYRALFICVLRSQHTHSVSGFGPNESSIVRRHHHPVFAILRESAATSTSAAVPAVSAPPPLLLPGTRCSEMAALRPVARTRTSGGTWTEAVVVRIALVAASTPERIRAGLSSSRHPHPGLS
ncbi:hypothetical protein C8R47DRAFT_323558 [Mycena vitilis]|nr:hypothetical protein C8R47DRAFT_323558 [Mycena vitilis]